MPASFPESSVRSTLQPANAWVTALRGSAKSTLVQRWEETT